MNRTRVALVFGTRPEAVKLAPVHAALMRRGDRFETRVIVTGQHREMLQQMLDAFGVVPDVNLAIMQEGQSLGEITCRALTGLQAVLHEERPDVILVQGDTTTVFAGALAAFYERIAVGHVEAGLRTSDKLSPYPEEINRRLTTPLADLHFAATRRARRNLLAENVAPRSIFVTGNTVVDGVGAA
jgi:UDP-N-acetylglucosamine 2-epimerase (non-hydrolysing)